MKNSKEFEEAFDSGSSHSICDCVCGRTYFDDSFPGGWDWEDGERERLVKLSKETPDKVIALDHSVCTMMINRNEIVYDCPCNQSIEFEKVLINNRRNIAKFLNLKAKKNLENAKEDLEVTNVIEN